MLEDEIRGLYDDLQHAEDNFMNADDDYIDAASYDVIAIKSRIDAGLRRLKNESRYI